MSTSRQNNSSSQQTHSLSYDDEEKQLLHSEFAKNSFNPEKWAEDRFENTTHQVSCELSFVTLIFLF
jgi:hypothetical protein